jgi:hypothetical protein
VLTGADTSNDALAPQIENLDTLLELRVLNLAGNQIRQASALTSVSLLDKNAQSCGERL